MRIRLSLSLNITRGQKKAAAGEPPMPAGALNDNDQTLVEHAGPQRMGFTVPHAAEPLGPEERHG